MKPETTTTVRYECARATDCTDRPGAECPGCNKITTKTTKRSIPKCEKFIGEAGYWQEVWMQQTVDGQRFFHGTKLWAPDPEGELPGDMIEQVSLGEMVPPLVDIQSCEDQGRVRFFVARFQ